MMSAKDGLLPRLTEEQIRKMVHWKDTALARILEEHESEMNVMATNMEELRARTLASSRLLRRRRRRARVAAVLGLAAAAIGGSLHEYRRREQVRVEISTGREAERLADAAAIAGLRGDVDALTSKLGDAEATIRYEEARHASILADHERLTRALEDARGKWRNHPNFPHRPIRPNSPTHGWRTS
jgi:predicted transcriptional regulator